MDRLWFKKIISYGIVCAFLSIFIVNCSNNQNNYNYKNYTQLGKSAKKTVMKSVPFSRKSLYYPSSLNVVGDYLIVIDTKSEKMLHIYDLKSKDLITSFGLRGQGPGEFVGPSDIVQSENQDEFWVFDLSARKIKRFNIKNLLNGKIEPEKTILFKEGVGPLKQVQFANNSIYGIGFFTKGRISIYDQNGEFKNNIGKIPLKLNKDKLAIQHSNGFEGKFVMKSKRNEFYVAPLLGSILEKYSMNGELMNSFYLTEKFFPDYDIVPAGQHMTITYNGRTRYGFIDIRYNKQSDSIFLLYSGRHFLDNNKMNKDVYKCKIYKIDHRDTLSEIIELDKDINQIAISHDGTSIYGISDKDIFEFSRVK